MGLTGGSKGNLLPFSNNSNNPTEGFGSIDLFIVPLKEGGTCVEIPIPQSVTQATLGNVSESQ